MSTPIPTVSFKDEAGCFELDLIELAELKQRVDTLQPTPNAPHRIGFNILLFAFDSEGEHLIDFERFSYGAASVLFLSQGQVQAFDFSGHVEGKLMLFTNTFLDSLQATMRIPFMLSGYDAGFSPKLVLNATLQQRVQRLLAELDVELALKTPEPTIVMALFSAIFLIIARARVNPADNLKSQDAKRFAVFLRLIARHFTQHRDAAFYADKLGMTYKTLNVLCKKVSGQTAKQYIDQHVVLEAKRCLVIDQTDIASLAYRLGFDEPSNFTKFFKRYTGVSPKQFTA